MKTNFKRLSSTGLILLGALAVSAQVQAATISFTDSFTALTADITSEQLRVNYFNDLSGTRILDNVSVSMTTKLTTAGTSTNTAGTAQTFRVTVTGDYWGDLMGNVVITPSPIEFMAFTTVASIPSATRAAGSVTPITGSTGDVLNDILVNSTANLASFIGASGTWGYDMNTIVGIATSGGGGNISTNVTTLADALLSVTYTYHDAAPVPEPSALGLMGLGFAGLATLVARKRKS